MIKLKPSSIPLFKLPFNFTSISLSSSATRSCYTVFDSMKPEQLLPGLLCSLETGNIIDEGQVVKYCKRDSALFPSSPFLLSPASSWKLSQNVSRYCISQIIWPQCKLAYKSPLNNEETVGISEVMGNAITEQKTSTTFNKTSKIYEGVVTAGRFTPTPYSPLIVLLSAGNSQLDASWDGISEDVQNFKATAQVDAAKLGFSELCKYAVEEGKMYYFCNDSDKETTNKDTDPDDSQESKDESSGSDTNSDDNTQTDGESTGTDTGSDDKKQRDGKSTDTDPDSDSNKESDGKSTDTDTDSDDKKQSDGKSTDTDTDSDDKKQSGDESTDSDTDSDENEQSEDESKDSDDKASADPDHTNTDPEDDEEIDILGIDSEDDHKAKRLKTDVAPTDGQEVNIQGADPKDDQAGDIQGADPVEEEVDIVGVDPEDDNRGNENDDGTATDHNDDHGGNTNGSAGGDTHDGDANNEKEEDATDYDDYEF